MIIVIIWKLQFPNAWMGAFPTGFIKSSKFTQRQNLPRGQLQKAKFFVPKISCDEDYLGVNDWL